MEPEQAGARGQPSVLDGDRRGLAQRAPLAAPPQVEIELQPTGLDLSEGATVGLSMMPATMQDDLLVEPGDIAVDLLSLTAILGRVAGACDGR